MQFQVLSVEIDSPFKLQKQIYCRLKQVLLSPLPDEICLFWWIPTTFNVCALLNICLVLHLACYSWSFITWFLADFDFRAEKWRRARLVLAKSTIRHTRCAGDVVAPLITSKKKNALLAVIRQKGKGPTRLDSWNGKYWQDRIQTDIRMYGIGHKRKLKTKKPWYDMTAILFNVTSRIFFPFYSVVGEIHSSSYHGHWTSPPFKSR